ncbi:hypothetical protein JG687_00009509 [Phytophthora cactorum]|uniref:Integrase catalytic domain-containing protein n=1 Tax=Phytophthora cactorum TaxID=29920 RepID=A0A8T1UBG9_9STRA|nr:hypothetical protein JG687_00009509 [Phytophthora cactorum]
MARSGEKPMKTTVSEQTGKSSHTNKRDVVVGEVVKRVARDYDSGCWYFDSGTNAHIVASKEYFTVLNSMEDSDWNPSMGFADGVDAQAEGFGTILLATMIDEDMVFVFVEDVLYVPKAGCNLFSPGQALEQGFKMSWDQEAMMFGMTKDDTEVIRAMYQHRLWTFDVHNIGGVKVSKKTIASKRQVVANFAVTDGVEDIDVWHARLGHTCPEYIRLMVDRRMAKGIMLKKRGKIDFADCRFGKQRRKTYQNKLVRNIEKVNDIVFADLLIPGLSNCTAYSAVLVVMDGYSRFVTTYLLKSRNEGEVNARMQEYIAWAERQHGRRINRVVTRQKFCNGTMERWYKKKGIVHTKVGPNASQLNPVERTHQTLIGMVKTVMHESGLPPSFWTHALETAVYVKNRVFCKGACRTPYELMFGTKPDIHHIRAFGSLAYCHTPKSKRKKLSMNCRIGFLIGYREDVVGCQVYFPTEHKRGFVSVVRINEQIKYSDRYEKGFKMKVDKWLQTFNEFIEYGEPENLVDDDEEDDASSQQAECDDNSVRDDSNVEMESVAASEEDLIAEELALWNGMVHNSAPQKYQESTQSNKLAGNDQQLWEDILHNSSLPDYADAFETQEGENAASVDTHEEDARSDGDFQDEDKAEDSDTDVDAGSEADEHDDGDIDYELENDESEAEYDSSEGDEIDDPPAPAGKGILAIPSQMLVGKYIPGSTYTGPQTYQVPKNQKRRKPERFEDYSVHSAFKALHADRRGKRGIRANDVKVPRNYREAMRSKHAKQWKEAMDQEIAGMTEKEVLKKIPRSEMPKGTRTLKTMWVFDIKVDHLSYVVRFRARLCGRGDKQRPELDYGETFSPVARMATFRLFVALCVYLQLTIYQGDINTAYLNALLAIKQYLEELEGYPCEEDGMVYMINKALYGLKQSGREWNAEINEWFLRYGFKQCSTEPCLYFYNRDGVFAMVLLYVDDILCATKD